jgi:UDP-3-O-[3-hydroxymyristoyl] N-acetylglucosamine deacetylase
VSPSDQSSGFLSYHTESCYPEDARGGFYKLWSSKMTNNNPVYQRTLKKSISCVGVGIHSGKKASITIHPAAESSGINFLRKDVPEGRGEIPAAWYSVTETRLSTILGNKYGTTVGTVEHLLAALRACGVDNALIEIDGPEVPVMDGSAGPFVDLIKQIGTKEQKALRWAIWIKEPIEVRDGDKFAVMMPYDRTRITVEIDFSDLGVKPQRRSIELQEDTFGRDIAYARTFGFKSQIDSLKKKGLARGGSLSNAVLVDQGQVVNKDGLRFQDEFVRHKILDCLGDLALVGLPVFGHYIAYKPGHALNVALIQRMFSQRSSWAYLPVDKIDQLLVEDSETESTLTVPQDRASVH